MCAIGHMLNSIDLWRKYDVRMRNVLTEINMLKVISVFYTPSNVVRLVHEIHTTTQSLETLQANNIVGLCGHIHNMLQIHRMGDFVKVCNAKMNGAFAFNKKFSKRSEANERCVWFGLQLGEVLWIVKHSDICSCVNHNGIRCVGGMHINT
jgi:hypothetical protein